MNPEEKKTPFLEVSPVKTKRKKPEGMPSRPLSGYNYFFKEERVRWLEEQASKGSNPDEDKSKNFVEMGKEIGARWRKLTADQRVRYTKLAEQDMKRYRIAVAEFKAKTAANESDGGKGGKGTEDRKRKAAKNESTSAEGSTRFSSQRKSDGEESQVLENAPAPHMQRLPSLAMTSASSSDPSPTVPQIGLNNVPRQESGMSHLLGHSSQLQTTQASSLGNLGDQEALAASLLLGRFASSSTQASYAAMPGSISEQGQLQGLSGIPQSALQLPQNQIAGVGVIPGGLGASNANYSTLLEPYQQQRIQQILLPPGPYPYSVLQDSLQLQTRINLEAHRQQLLREELLRQNAGRSQQFGSLQLLQAQLQQDSLRGSTAAAPDSFLVQRLLLGSSNQTQVSTPFAIGSQDHTSPMERALLLRSLLSSNQNVAASLPTVTSLPQETQAASRSSEFPPPDENPEEGS